MPDRMARMADVPNCIGATVRLCLGRLEVGLQAGADGDEFAATAAAAAVVETNCHAILKLSKC